jgi:MFS family permease
LADHAGRRVWLLRAAAAASLLMSGLLQPSHAWGWLPACVFLLFICNGGVVPLSESALARFLHTDGGMDTRRYGRFRVWGSIGFILAVTAAGFLLESAGIGAFPWVVELGYGKPVVGLVWAVSGVVGGLGGGLLTEHLGFKSVFGAATASASIAVFCAHQLARHLRDQG